MPSKDKKKGGLRGTLRYKKKLKMKINARRPQIASNVAHLILGILPGLQMEKAAEVLQLART